MDAFLPEKHNSPMALDFVSGNTVFNFVGVAKRVENDTSDCAQQGSILSLP